MEQADVINIIQQAIPEAKIQVEGADCNFKVVVVSESFAGLLEVKRQRTILTLFSDQLRSGALHALTVKAYTPAEWSAQPQAQLTQLAL
jgi:acid stress-induced BolA-like protein IbaG/YrbA